MAEAPNTKNEQGGETQIGFPQMTENKGTLTLTMTIDKSVSKVAAWVVGVIIGCAVLIGAGCILAVWMIIAYRETEREVRLQRLETDEMNIRLELAKIPKHQPGDKP